MATTRKIALLITELTLILGAEMSIAEVVPVVSAHNPVNALSRYELVNIFLGKTRRFPNGDSVIPIDQTEDSSTRLEFYNEYAGKSAAQLKAYWSKMIFTGRGQPPRMVANGEDVKQWLADNPNAIGYISQELVDSSVKILQVQ